MTRVFTQTFGVVGGIIERNGKFVLIREAQGVEKGKWNIPAGWIDVGENPVAAAKREVQEETGHVFEPKLLLGIYSLVRADLTAILGSPPHAIKLIFTGDLSDTPVASPDDDIAEVKWFSPEEIEAMDATTLRELDIKQMIKDYHAGKRYPLEVVAAHTFVAP
jgi:ADP-ribose pyrophosphatase YjhB (NUDIX family)